MPLQATLKVLQPVSNIPCSAHVSVYLKTLEPEHEPAIDCRRSSRQEPRSEETCPVAFQRFRGKCGNDRLLRVFLAASRRAFRLNSPPLSLCGALSSGHSAITPGHNEAYATFPAAIREQLPLERDIIRDGAMWCLLGHRHPTCRAVLRQQGNTPLHWGSRRHFLLGCCLRGRLVIRSSSHEPYSRISARHRSSTAAAAAASAASAAPAPTGCTAWRVNPWRWCNRGIAHCALSQQACLSCVVWLPE